SRDARARRRLRPDDGHRVRPVAARARPRRAGGGAVPRRDCARAALAAPARRAPRPRSTLLRLVVANIHRPGALTPTVVLSLGLGLALLVTLTLIDANLRRQFSQALPDRAPSFYFVDIQGAEAARFEAFVRARAPDAKLEQVPMLRGRIVAARGVKAEDLRPPDNAAW